MFKKILTFQGIITMQDYKPRKLILFYIGSFFVCIFLYATLHISSSTILVAALLIFYIYRFINSEKKVYSLIPVSNIFLVGNFFLMPILIPIVSSLSIIGFGFISTCLIHIISTIISSGKSDVLDSYSQYLIDSLGIWKGILLLGLVYLIYISAFTAISFIKNKIIRLSGIVVITAVAYIFLIYIKRLILIFTSIEEYDFANGFSHLPQADNILIWVGVTVLVVIPLSIYAAYRIYIHEK